MCACCVISWQFRVWGQTEWSGLQGRPLTDFFVCGGEIPNDRSCCPGNRVRSQAHSEQESLELCVPRVRLCWCHVWKRKMEEGQAGLWEHDPTSREGEGGGGEITTRMDGRSTERGNNRREHELGTCAEYESADVQLSCLFHTKNKKSNKKNYCIKTFGRGTN